MKNYPIVFLGILFVLLLGACQKESVEYTFGDEDYVIFGKYYGECMGDCVHLYRLTTSELFEDDQEWGVPDEFPFFSTSMASSKFEAAKHLLGSIPKDLKSASQSTYGCPDCADQGGFYLELMEDGEKRKWHIDVWDEGQSSEIINYKAQIDLVVNDI